MCLAIPCQVVELLPAEMAVIELSGIRRNISLALVEQVAVGDWVLVHVGYALSKLDPEEARKTLEILTEISEAGLAATRSGS